MEAEHAAATPERAAAREYEEDAGCVWLLYGTPLRKVPERALSAALGSVPPQAAMED